MYNHCKELFIITVIFINMQRIFCMSLLYLCHNMLHMCSARNFVCWCVAKMLGSLFSVPKNKWKPLEIEAHFPRERHRYARSRNGECFHRSRKVSKSSIDFFLVFLFLSFCFLNYFFMTELFREYVFALSLLLLPRKQIDVAKFCHIFYVYFHFLCSFFQEVAVTGTRRLTITAHNMATMRLASPAEVRNREAGAIVARWIKLILIRA